MYLFPFTFLLFIVRPSISLVTPSPPGPHDCGTMVAHEGGGVAFETNPQAVFATPVPPVTHACGTEINNEDIIKAEADFVQFKLTGDMAAAALTRNATIPVHFHVVRKDKTEAGGSVPCVAFLDWFYDGPADVDHTYQI